MKWWWMSFKDPGRPRGQRFLGVCVVRAEDLPGALRTSWLMKCNPGGEVATWVIPVDRLPPDQKLVFEEMPKFRLLSLAELVNLGYDAQSVLT